MNGGTTLGPNGTAAPASSSAGNKTLAVDWAVTLQPICSVGAGSRSLDSFNVAIPSVGVTHRFAPRAVANAINTSSSATVQQALRRTSSRAFAAILKAAWRLHIDTVDLSNSWRPMLDSRLREMGVGLDITQFVDSVEYINCRIRNNGAGDRLHPFPTGAGCQKMARLYQELRGDGEVSASAVYTPWLNWIEPNDTHMHITVKHE